MGQAVKRSIIFKILKWKKLYIFYPTEWAIASGNFDCLDL